MSTKCQNFWQPREWLDYNSNIIIRILLIIIIIITIINKNSNMGNWDGFKTFMWGSELFFLQKYQHQHLLNYKNACLESLHAN